MKNWLNRQPIKKGMSGKFNGMNNKKNPENWTVNREVGLKKLSKRRTATYSNGIFMLIRKVPPFHCGDFSENTVRLNLGVFSFQAAKSLRFTMETFRRI